MLKVSDRSSPHGQSTSLINSITILFLLLAQPISTAKDNADETDEASSEEYDSEYDEDKERIDIRPLRDSRTKHVNISTQPTPVSGDGYSLPTGTKSPTTTVKSLKFATEDEEVYTGTFKNVHNRKDFNYSGFTLPTIIGTLFTVNIDEWKRSKYAPTSPRPPKLIDPSMMKYFSPRPNFTYEAEYRRFVNWANKKSKADQLSTTTHVLTTKVRDTFTLYPQESTNDTDFQQYMAKNWGNASAFLHYRASKNISGDPSSKPKSWLDRIALREFRSLPWRNRVNQTFRSWRRRPYALPNESYYDTYVQQSSRPRRPYPHYWDGEGNGTRMDDYPRRSGWRKPSYYWTMENNQSVMREVGPEPWRRRRPYYIEGNETKFGENETGPVEFRPRPWREPWMGRPRRRWFGPPMGADSFNRSREFEGEPWPEERRFEDRGPPLWDDRDFIPPPPPPPPPMPPYPPPYPPRRPEFGPRDYVDEPPLGYSREFEPRYESRELDRHDYSPADNRSSPREHYDERIPPSRERDSYDQRAEFDKPPRGRGYDGGDKEFDERRPSRGREQFDDRHSREKDFDAREPRRRQDFEDRPSRDRDYDREEPQRGRQEFDDRPSRDRDYDRKEPQQGRQEFDDRPSRDRDYDRKEPQQGRQEFDDRPSRDRDYDRKEPQQGRQEFDDRRSRDRDFDDRGSQRRRPEFDDGRSRDRDYRSRKPQRDRQEFSITDSTNRSSLEEGVSKSSREQSEAYSRPYERRGYHHGDRDSRASTREYSSYRKTDRYQSISRAGRDFYDRKRGTTTGATGSTRDQFAEHAKLYRLRIEQRREKELQKIEKKRKRFWRPTESGETTTDEIDTTTTIKTTTRKSYAKGKKMKLEEGAEVTTEGYWYDDEVELTDSDDPYVNVTHPYNEKYVREYQEAKENVTRYSDKYDWITTPDPNKPTIRLGVKVSTTPGERLGTGTGDSTQSSPEAAKARKGFLKDKGNRPPPRPQKKTKGSKKGGSKKGGSKKKKG